MKDWEPLAMDKAEELRRWGTGRFSGKQKSRRNALVDRLQRFELKATAKRAERAEIQVISARDAVGDVNRCSV